MDIAQHMEQLQKLSVFAASQAVQAIIVPRANELLAVTKNRIQQRGMDSNGTSIGAYSRKSGYYGREEFMNKGSFAPQGKFGRSKSARTMYLPQGYYQFRQIQGREVAFTNLTLSGDTMQRYQMAVTGGSILMGMTTQRASGIRKGQEKKKGRPIFHSSKEEIAEYNKEVLNDFKHINEEILSGK
jgi:hypothetical protein